MNAGKDYYGEDRFRKIIKESMPKNPKAFSEFLLARIREFSGQDEFNDELTMIVFDVL